MENLKIKKIVLGISALPVSLGCMAINQTEVTEQRNILVIVCDQLRPDFLNVYGGKMIECEGTNELARMGVVFDNAITASPVSAPARASMMTGRYPSTHGVWCNDRPFNEGMEYLPQRMADNGYITAAFGKLHHTPAADSKGFDVYIPMEESRLKEMEPYVAYMKGRYPGIKMDRYNDLSKNFGFEKPMADHYDYWTTTNALCFLTDYKENKFEGKPFFVWLSLQGPHGPYDPPAEVKGKADASQIPDRIKEVSGDIPSVVEKRQAFHMTEDGMKKSRIAYAEKLKMEDEQVERVLNRLKENNLLEKTTILFVADHGDQIGDHNLNQKGPFPYPYHQNIPMILANCPGVKGGTRSDILVSNIDIATTCLELAGDKRPLGLSRSLAGMLNDPAMQREVNFSEFCDSYKMVENKLYRMAYYPFEGKIMLFDKLKDPCYLQNLSGSESLASVKLDFMKSLMDFQVVCKGVHVEAQDCTTEVQNGIGKLHPDWKNDGFEVNFPLTYSKWKYLKEHNQDYHYNDFCLPMKVMRAYGAFWEHPAYKKEKTTINK